MNTTTPDNTATTPAPLTVKELAAKRKALRDEAKALNQTLDQKREEARTQEQEDAKKLLADIKNLHASSVVVGEGDKAITLTLEEALLTGKATTIVVQTKEGSKERAHTAFMDAARVESLRKILIRAKKIMSNEEIRPKSNPKQDTASA